MHPSSYYSFVRVEDEDLSIYYQFLTDNNIAYTVYFKIDEYGQYVNQFPVLLEQGYAFGFRKQKFNNEDKNVKDELVFPTIYAIALDFFKEKGKETVLLYHCDHSDNRQSSRNKLFNKWGQHIISDSLFVKHSIEFEINSSDTETVSMYLGFITASDNPLLGDIKNEFYEFSLFIIQPKA